ncbi:MAG: bile acid:sodium symporter family protein [Saprospiraceae bacterium]|nr:bile acid:sodium symporter family protein [Saprospiraceae bacterium]MCB9324251.1 bile acid:sodium symporter family protein [Lewinellaceae bacterium]
MVSVDILIRFILALVMLGVGMSIEASNFKGVFQRPKSFLLGLFSQMVALPAFAILMVYLSPLSPEFKIGIIILSLCPGGNMSNYISYLTRANTALAISLTTINGLLTVFTIPLVSNWASRTFRGQEEWFSLPFLSTAMEIFLLILLPAAIGVLIRYFRHELVEKIENPVKWITYLLLVIMFCILFFGREAQGGLNLTFEDIYKILPFTLALNFFGMLFGYYFAKWNKLSKRNGITISIETGLQNTALALLVTGTLLNDSEMAKPALIYAAFSFWTTLGFAYFMKKRTGLK